MEDYGTIYSNSNLGNHHLILNLKMNIKNILKQNEESFFPWSDFQTPPLDTNKSVNNFFPQGYVIEENEGMEDFEGWKGLY